jgi:1-acyl-sn-glycerol-3-phosphate acyltransferase
MKKLFLYPISLVYYFFFLVVMCFFQPFLWLFYTLFGYIGLKKTFDIVTFLSLKCTHILGCRYTFENMDVIPENVPLLFVSNHQSLSDTAGMNWYLRQFHPAFVTKKELGKGIPSLSYYLRKGACVLIDRNNPKQALPQLKALAEYIEKEKRAAILFPEGTRSKTGEPKQFAQGGLKIVCKYAPSAYVVPVSINNSWKVYQHGYFALSLGHHLLFTIHEPLKISDYTFDELLEKTEKTIKQGVHSN